jgi:hypothetical protein
VSEKFEKSEAFDRTSELRLSNWFRATTVFRFSDFFNNSYVIYRSDVYADSLNMSESDGFGDTFNFMTSGSMPITFTLPNSGALGNSQDNRRSSVIHNSRVFSESSVLGNTNLVSGSAKFESSDGLDEPSLTSGSRFAGQSVGITVGVVVFLAVCVGLVVLYFKLQAFRNAVSDYSGKEMIPESMTTTQGSGVWDNCPDDIDDILMTEMNILTAGGPVVESLWGCE